MISLTSLSHGLIAESLRAVGCVAAVAVALATVCGEGQQAVAADRRIAIAAALRAEASGSIAVDVACSENSAPAP